MTKSDGQSKSQRSYSRSQGDYGAHWDAGCESRAEKWLGKNTLQLRTLLQRDQEVEDPVSAQTGSSMGWSSSCHCGQRSQNQHFHTPTIDLGGVSEPPHEIWESERKQSLRLVYWRTPHFPGLWTCLLGCLTVLGGQIKH
jgi:hypothetical protein